MSVKSRIFPKIEFETTMVSLDFFELKENLEINVFVILVRNNPSDFVIIKH